MTWNLVVSVVSSYLDQALILYTQAASGCPPVARALSLSLSLSLWWWWCTLLHAALETTDHTTN